MTDYPDHHNDPHPADDLHSNDDQHSRDDHSHDDDHDHSHDDATDLGFGVLTISSSRSLDSDPSGDAIAAAVREAGGTVEARELVTDDRAAIRAAVASLATRDGVDVVITTGGTGLTPDDVTVEAVYPLLDREIPGFGELFRVVSYEEIGPRALLSRAIGGVSGRTPVFCLPGSENAAITGTEELVLPVIGHLVGHVLRDG